METVQRRTRKQRPIPEKILHPALVALVATAALMAWAPPAPASGNPATVPTVTDVRLVAGAPDMYNAAPLVTNLDAGSKVAGITGWDHDDDGFYNQEAWVGFLWSPSEGSRAFSPDDSASGIKTTFDWYWGWNRFAPSGVSDGGTVVGNHIFYSGFFPIIYPYVWSAADGYRILPLPCFQPGDAGPATFEAPCLGAVSDISRNGSTAVGSVRTDFSYATPEQAGRWRITRTADGLKVKLDTLATTATWSRAWDTSADGSVIVGEAGPDEMVMQAVRWVFGRSQPLEWVGETSIARFTSSDGSAAIGTANLGGQQVLVRWNAAGAATVAVPPYGMSVESIQAINPAGTAAVGALSQGGPMGNGSPYLWTSTGGFTVLPKLGHEAEYDASEAMDLSDDGTRVVGMLSARFAGPSSPPPLGFFWSPTTGTMAIDDLLTASGRPALGTYFAFAISGDGLRILASGDPERTEHDSNSYLITLRP